MSAWTMFQTLGTTVEFRWVLLVVLLVEEGWGGGLRWDTRPRRGVIVGVEEDVRGEAWAESETGDGAEVERGVWHGTVTGIKVGL